MVHNVSRPQPPPSTATPLSVLDIYAAPSMRQGHHVPMRPSCDHWIGPLMTRRRPSFFCLKHIDTHGHTRAHVYAYAPPSLSALRNDHEMNGLTEAIEDQQVFDYHRTLTHLYVMSSHVLGASLNLEPPITQLHTHTHTHMHAYKHWYMECHMVSRIHQLILV